MGSKLKTITLSSGWVTLQSNPTKIDPNVQPNGYRVEKVTDSVQYTPGQMLDRAEVANLCDRAAWKVTIVAYKPTGERT